jgi:Flp pilus assembly protein CpaB
MHKVRGLIALALSLLIAFLVAVAVYRNVSRNVSRSRAQPVVPKTAKPVHSPGTFSQTIPEGMRAFSVKVDPASGWSGKIKKGDTIRFFQHPTNLFSLLV